MDKRFGIAMGLFLLIGLVAAQNLPPLPPTQSVAWTFNVTDAHGALPDDSIVQVDYALQDGRTGQTLLVAKSHGLLTFYAPNGGAVLTSVGFLYDDPATPTADGMAKEDLGAMPTPDANTSAPILVQLQAIGGLVGTLTHSDGRPAPDAAIEIDCAGGQRQTGVSSSTGAFSFDHVDAGQCLVSANEKESNQTAQATVEVHVGQLAATSLQLQAPAVASPPQANNGMQTLEIAGLILLGIAALLWMQKKPGMGSGQEMTGSTGAAGRKSARASSRTKTAVLTTGPAHASAMTHSAASAPHHADPAVPDARQQDLLATLGPGEKDIVAFVQKSAPAAMQGSKIRRALLIPKTTFTRTLQALERKQFLELKKDGARVHVRLHEFYRKGQN